MEGLRIHAEEEFDTGEKLPEMERLDESFEMPFDGKYGIIGILEGVKKGCEIEVAREKDLMGESEAEIEGILDSMDFKYFKRTGDYEGLPGIMWTQYFVSPDEEVAKRLETLFTMRTNSREEWIECEREKGEILGYPKTATEYFIDRQLSGDEGGELDEMDEKYHSYVHSPEHAEEEYWQYEAKLDEVFRRHCPKTAERVLGKE